jgi:regulator of protease activity HflC (stomatin/prohibitin superfamily)
MASIDLFPMGMLAALGLAALSSLFDGKLARWARFGALAAALCALGVLAFNAVIIVRPGTVKVESLFGTLRPVPYEEGMHVVSPFAHQHEMSVRRQSIDFTGDEALLVASRDGRTLKVDLSIPFSLHGACAPTIYGALGGDGDYIPQVASMASAAVADTAAEWAWRGAAHDKRAQFAADIQRRFEEILLADLVSIGFTPEKAAMAIVAHPLQLHGVTPVEGA